MKIAPVRLYELFETIVNDRPDLVTNVQNPSLYKHYVDKIIEVNGENKIKNLDNDKIYKMFRSVGDYITSTGKTWKLYTNIGQYKIPFIY